MSITAKRKRGRPRDDAIARQRREQILDVAMRAFARHGYRRTDLQAVADALGVGKGTVYRYFPSKRDLFLGAVDRGMRLLKEWVDAAAAHTADPMERIARGIQAYLEFFDANPAICELLIQERAEFRDRKTSTYFQHREVNVKHWQELYSDLIANGRVRAVPVERITDVIGQLLYGTMCTNYFTGRRKSAEEQARDILDVVFHGILSERERKAKADERAGTTG